MDIQSISIVPESVGCNAKCKYCIASMTYTPNKGDRLDFNRLSNALQYATAGKAQTAILTSKGETLMSDWDYLGDILKLTKEHGFGQRDLHSNMSLVKGREEEFLEKLVNKPYGLTNVTVTVASLDPVINSDLMGIDINYGELFRFLRKDADIAVRLSCVMNKEAVYDRQTMEDYISKAKEHDISQIVFRGLWTPDNSRENKVSRWSREHKIEIDIANNALEAMVLENKAFKIFDLPWGQTVYDMDGINTTAATCTVNYFKDSIKSLVFLPNNHMYSTWEFEGSIIM